MLQERSTTCPVCRIEGECVRNLVTQSALAKLLKECSACNLEVKREELSQHQVKECSGKVDKTP